MLFFSPLIWGYVFDLFLQFVYHLSQQPQSQTLFSFCPEHLDLLQLPWHHGAGPSTAMLLHLINCTLCKLNTRPNSITPNMTNMITKKRKINKLDATWVFPALRARRHSSMRCSVSTERTCWLLSGFPNLDSRACWVTERKVRMGSTTVKSLSTSSWECRRHWLHTSLRATSEKGLIWEDNSC